ncbi:MAG: hypothetical protein AAGC46_04850 [Solirubrobacteraceae bacterium]|nr:hypothetical protein [Patulibacter sp.]
MRHPLRRLGRDVVTVLRGVGVEDAVGPDDPRIKRAARSITDLYGLMAVGVLLWMVYLAMALPERNTSLHYDVTWVGFDGFLVIAMGLTAWFAYRVDPRVELAANATATLLLVDAWMDTTTSSTNSALITAILFAVFLELPLAVLSIRIARNVHRSLATRARSVGAAAIQTGASSRAADALDAAPAAPPSGP